MQLKPMSQPPPPKPPPPQHACPEPPHAVQVPPIPIVAPVHVPPIWQTSPGQHAPPTAPQFMHVRGIPFPPAQARPLLHMPAQHSWPLAPHGWQVAPPSPPPPWHDRPDVHASVPPPAQHSAPRLPHATHVPPAQRAPEAVQLMKPPPPPPSTGAPPQQVSPTAPQAAPLAFLHDPFEQVPVVPAPMQVEPLPTHMPPTQQPPAWQLFAAQHARPGAPQLLLPLPPPVPVTPGRPLVLALHAAPATTSNAISAQPRKRSNRIFDGFIGDPLRTLVPLRGSLHQRRRGRVRDARHMPPRAC